MAMVVALVAPFQPEIALAVGAVMPLQALAKVIDGVFIEPVRPVPALAALAARPVLMD
jgi:hypothetical protein